MTRNGWQNILGWFDFPEIYDEAVDRAQSQDILVEIGAWFGKSTAYLAEKIIDSKKDITFYTVDTWQGSPESATQRGIVNAHGGDLFPAFWRNMTQAGVQDAVIPLQMTSEEASQVFEDDRLAFVFIDGSHTYSAVTGDLRMWYPKIKIGGFIGGHDFSPRFDVPTAVQDFFKEDYVVIPPKRLTLAGRQKSGSWLHKKRN